MTATLDGIRRYLPILIAAPVLLAPVLFVPQEGPWQGLRWFVVQAVCLAMLVSLALQARGTLGNLRPFLTTGPNAAVLALPAWAVFSFLTTAPTAGRGREMALLETLRLLSGAVIYFAVAYGDTSRQRLDLWVKLLLGGGAVAAFAGLATSSQQEIGLATAAFANAQLLAGFLVLLLPFALVYAFRGEMDLRRVLATVALIFVTGALLLTRNRSAWLGTCLGLFVVAGLWLRSVSWSDLAQQKHRWLAGLIIALVAGGLFVGLTPRTGTVVEQRASTLLSPGKEPSLQWRFRMWGIAGEMVRARPLAGWGVGSFPRLAGDYLAEVPHAAQVDEVGPSLANVPHNEYVQLAAELGIVGLGLYLAVLLGFLVRCARALASVRSETRRWVTVAALAAVAAQIVDAFGNPAWRFGDVAPLFWLVLGLGMAATRTRSEREPAGAPVEPKRTPVAPRLAWVTASLVGTIGLGASAFGASIGGQPGILRSYYDPRAIPTVVITPASLNVNFGTVRIRPRRPLPQVQRVFRVACGGGRAALLEGFITLEPGSAFELVDATPTPIRLIKPRSITYRVRFKPQAPGAYTGQITVRTNDRTNPVKTLTLTGIAL